MSDPRDARPGGDGTGLRGGRRGPVRTLARCLEAAGPMGGAELLTGLVPLVRDLARIHDAGEIHGGLTPSAVSVDASGVWHLPPCESRPHPVESGPPEAFAAPERDEGAPPSSASDAYALGALAWFAVTGAPPPPAAWRPRLDEIADVPTSVAEAVTACLSMTATARPSVRQFADRLTEVRGPSSRPVPRSRPRRYPSRRERREDVRTRAARRAARRVARTRHVVVGLSVLAITALTAGVWWPGAHQGAAGALTSVKAGPPPIAATPSRPSNPTPRPIPRRTRTRVELPGRADVTRLLSCRARAWNTGAVHRLRACLAEDSQALADDIRRLETAAARGVRYRSVRFTVEHVERIVLEHGDPMARVTVQRAPYLVITPDGGERRDGVTETVRLVFSGGPGRWRLAAWNLVDAQRSATSRSRS